jgi:hypothetical protein
LADGIAPIEFGDVVDDVTPASNTEVYIDVRKRDSARVKKSLED